MSEIILYDYEEEDWFGTVRYGIGQGLLTSQNIISQIESSTGDLTLRINSGGGYVFDGFAIYNAFKSYSGGKKIARIEGIAASIASIIAMAADEVVICQAAMIMVHKPSTFAFGMVDADFLTREANALNEIQAVLNDIYTSKTGLPTSKVESLINAETWLTPDTALALGFADSIEKTIKEKPVIAQNMFDHLFSNSNEGIKAYANNAFTIKLNQSMSTVKELAEKQDKTNSILDSILNMFTKKNKAEETDAPPVEPVVAPVVPAEPTEDVEALKARITELEAEKVADKEKVDNAQGILDKANEMYDKVQNQLAEIKSTYKPEGAEPKFQNSGNGKTERFSHLAKQD